jgi:hypothetical protein
MALVCFPQYLGTLMFVSYKNDQGLKPKVEIIEATNGELKYSLELDNNSPIQHLSCEDDFKVVASIFYKKK